MTTGSKIWATVVVIGIFVLAGLSIEGNNSSSAAARNARVTQQTSDRTECIRAISNELDHAHWTLIGEAFNTTTRAQAASIGLQLASLPLVVDIAEHGGSILKARFDACPPAPTKETP